MASTGETASGSDRREPLTVVVFKDNLAARTFRVPLAWISRFGLVLGLGVGSILVLSFLAFKYYRLSDIGDPGKVIELERKLALLGQSYDEVKAEAERLATAQAEVTISPQAEPATPTGAPAATAPAAAAPGSPLIFTAVPPGTRVLQLPTPPVTIEAFRARADRVGLDIRFNLIYAKKDGRNQSGRIVLLARGPETLLAYPEGVLNPGDGTGSLIDPSRGEYFSVSRFRETTARFPLPTSRGGLKKIQVILFDLSGSILIDQSFATNDGGEVNP